MKPTKILTLITLLAAALSSTAQAGPGASGGGNAMVCFDDPSIPTRIRAEKLNGNGYIGDQDISHITKVEILDLYEARQPVGSIGSTPSSKKLIEAKPGESVDQYTARLLSRFSELAPGLIDTIDRGRQALSVYKQFPNGLDPIDDVGPGETVNTRDCVRATIIAQYNRSDSDFIGYDPRIFNLPDSIFSVTSKALSQIHEWIYWVARTYGRATSSDSTRDLIGAMISDDQSLYDFFTHLFDISGDSLIGGNVSYFFPGAIIKDNGSYIYKLAKAVLADLHALQIDQYRQKKKFLQSNESLLKDCQKNAEIQLTQPMLDRYNQIWRPKLLAVKYVPTDILQTVDNIFQNFRPDADFSRDNQGNITSCLASFRLDSYIYRHRQGGMSWHADGFHYPGLDNNGNPIGYFDFQLPKGDDL